MRKINYKYYLPLLALSLLIFFTACEDVVEIELDEAAPILVVDAWINDQSGPQTIRLTNTAPYFESAPTPGIPGATITVSSSSGKIIDFTDVGNGDYIWTPDPNERIGTVGDEFVLSIDLDGKSYAAYSKLNRVPPIDSIGQETIEESSFAEESIRCNFYARDPLGPGDTYWIKTFRNGQFLAQPAELNIAFDAGFSQGSEVDGIIFITPIRETMNPVADPLENGEKFPSPWNVGDEVRVEIHSLNLDAYYFLDIVQTQLLNSQNTIFAEPLTNSPSNVVAEDGDEVLGMFVTSAVSAMDYVVK